MGDDDERLRAEGRREAEIKGIGKRVEDIHVDLKERIRALEANQRWGVMTIIGLVLATVAQWIQRAGAGQ